MSSEDLDQPVNSCSLVRIITGDILDSQGCKISSRGQQRLIRLRRVYVRRMSHPFYLEYVLFVHKHEKNENLKGCLWKPRTHKRTKIRDSVLLSLHIQLQ